MKTVLVGESNYAEFEVLNDFLTGKGYQVHWVKSGPDVIRAYAEIKPDLIILDALIPGMTGLKVCQAIKKLDGEENVRTIVLSKVYRQFQKQYESRTKVGVDAYGEKPVNVAELEKVLQKLQLEMGAPATAAHKPAPAMAEAVAEAVADAEIVAEAIPIAPTGKSERPVLEEPKRRLSAAGNLSETPFPKLLYFLHKFRRTGALRVVHEHISKVIYLRQGNPVFVTSNLSNESLGRFMVAKGMITVESYNSSLERMLATGKQQGNVLLEMGVISPHQLYEALEAQIREKILRIFAWEEGEYEFRPGKYDIDQSMQLNIQSMSVIFEGIKRFYTLARLEKYFNEYKNQRLVRVPESMLDRGEMQFKPHEAKFIKLIDGDRTVGKIIARSNLSLSETFQILYFLLLIEVIRFVGDPGFSSRSEKTHAAYTAERRERRETWRRLAEDKEGVQADRMTTFRRDLSRFFEDIDRLNYYEMFGLQPDAANEDIKRSYHTLTRKYHPYDLYNDVNEVLKAKSDGIFRSLTMAYETLMNAEKRKEYDASLDKRVTTERISDEAQQKAKLDLELDIEAKEEKYVNVSQPEEESLVGPDIEWDVQADLAVGDQDDTQVELEKFEDGGDEETLKEASEVTVSMANAVKSELLFQQGEDLLHDEQYERAAELFSKALELNPKEAEYFAYLGWATFRQNPHDPQHLAQGRDLLEKAVSINPGLDQGYTFLGMLEHRVGRKDRAREYFQKALQYNPENENAEQELKKLEVG